MLNGVRFIAVNQRRDRKERRREQTREEILDAARRVLLDRGIAGLTLAAVARELSLTKAALYYYFDSKDTLTFELLYAGLEAHAEVVGAAVDAAETGLDALEALIRSSAAHYSARKDYLRLAYMAPQVGAAGQAQLDPDKVERIRPFNDRMYGTVAAKIRADQDAGRLDASVDARRLAFTAHMSVVGVLTMEGLIEAANDAPLIHPHEAMVDELVAAFRARLAAAR